MSGPRYEKPVDTARSVYISDARADDEGGDVYELRFCGVPDCGEPLPLDRPGRVLVIGGERTTCCSACARRYSREKG